MIRLWSFRWMDCIIPIIRNHRERLMDLEPVIPIRKYFPGTKRRYGMQHQKMGGNGRSKGRQLLLARKAPMMTGLFLLLKSLYMKENITLFINVLKHHI